MRLFVFVLLSTVACASDQGAAQPGKFHLAEYQRGQAQVVASVPGVVVVADSVTELPGKKAEPKAGSASQDNVPANSPRDDGEGDPPEREVVPYDLHLVATKGPIGEIAPSDSMITMEVTLENSGADTTPVSKVTFQDPRGEGHGPSVTLVPPVAPGERVVVKVRVGRPVDDRLVCYLGTIEPVEE